MIGNTKSRAHNAPTRAAARLALLVFGIATAVCVACWQNLRERQLHVVQTSVERLTAWSTQDARRELMGAGLRRDRRQKTLQRVARTGETLLPPTLRTTGATLELYLLAPPISERRPASEAVQREESHS
ncbi:hypothetical protein AWB81_06844 [Caballeronia arationis]|jgi:hypothetical protein|uniref:Uncharacterized protein n=1 Tax=Caballeronia arationis TaxID=1777142 RepID=A0A7Z7I668_9BURK|nr:hypothetical protein AWB81_06844 [Caballeronia arationis]SOE67088.1 hypothetical protein SAMN05446927_3218 [Caballeronia arationis]